MASPVTCRGRAVSSPGGRGHRITEKPEQTTRTSRRGDPEISIRRPPDLWLLPGQRVIVGDVEYEGVANDKAKPVSGRIAPSDTDEYKAWSATEDAANQLAHDNGPDGLRKRAEFLTTRLFRSLSGVPPEHRCEDGLPTQEVLELLDVAYSPEDNFETKFWACQMQASRHELQVLLEQLE